MKENEWSQIIDECKGVIQQMMSLITFEQPERQQTENIDQDEKRLELGVQAYEKQIDQVNEQTIYALIQDLQRLSRPLLALMDQFEDRVECVNTMQDELQEIQVKLGKIRQENDVK